jgi:hypothetical protein
MASMHPPPVGPVDHQEDVATLWRDLQAAADAGDVQAAVFLQTFAPWAEEQLRMRGQDRGQVNHE